MTWLILWIILCPLGVAVMLTCQWLANAKPRRPDWRAPLYRALLPR